METQTTFASAERHEERLQAAGWPIKLYVVGNNIQGTCAGITRTAVTLQGQLPLTAGTIVDAVITLGSERDLQFTAEVVRLGDNRFALRFIKLDQVSLVRLYTLLAS